MPPCRLIGLKRKIKNSETLNSCIDRYTAKFVKK